MTMCTDVSSALARLAVLLALFRCFPVHVKGECSRVHSIQNNDDKTSMVPGDTSEMCQGLQESAACRCVGETDWAVQLDFCARSTENRSLELNVRARHILPYARAVTITLVVFGEPIEFLEERIELENEPELWLSCNMAIENTRDFVVSLEMDVHCDRTSAGSFEYSFVGTKAPTNSCNPEPPPISIPPPSEVRRRPPGKVLGNSLAYMLPSAVVVVSLLTAAAIYIARCLWKNRYRPRRRESSPAIPLYNEKLINNKADLTADVQYDAKGCPSMLWYHPDNENHTDQVNLLVEHLKSRGIQVDGVTGDQEITKNWRDFAEKAGSQYQDILVVMSERLLELCVNRDSSSHADILAERNHEYIPCVALGQLRVTHQNIEFSGKRAEFSVHFIVFEDDDLVLVEQFRRHFSSFLNANNTYCYLINRNFSNSEQLIERLKARTFPPWNIGNKVGKDELSEEKSLLLESSKDRPVIEHTVAMI